MSNDRNTRKRPVPVVLIAGGIGFALALVFLEVTFRIAGVGSDQFLRPDATLGVRFIPSKSGQSRAACYRAHPTTNKFGWRDRDRELPKDEGVFRVLILGDSYTAGLQVEDEEVFSAVLEQRLSALRPGRFEVLNMGVPSWGTDQEYLALREYGVAFDPDLVVLAFYAQNDVSNNSRTLEGTGYPKPFFDVENGKLVELGFVDDTPAAIAAARRVASPFRLYPWTRDALMTIPAGHQILYRLGIVGVAPRSSAPAPAGERALWNWPDRWTTQTGAYVEDDPEEWIRAWDITEQLILGIRNLAHRNGADFLLVGLPDPIAVVPQRLLTAVESRGSMGPLDPNKPTRRLDRLASRQSITFFSLVDGFRSRIAEDPDNLGRLYLPCDGHFSPLGHSLTADLLTPVVLDYAR